jgi:hypothetical protein
MGKHTAFYGAAASQFKGVWQATAIEFCRYGFPIFRIHFSMRRHEKERQTSSETDKMPSISGD